MKNSAIFLIVLLLTVFAAPLLLADEPVTDGVAGCSGLAINPDLSLEDQQSVCNAAENDPSTSCATSGNGVCSSPKLNNTLPDANHCICVGEVTEEAPLES